MVHIDLVWLCIRTMSGLTDTPIVGRWGWVNQNKWRLAHLVQEVGSTSIPGKQYVAPLVEGAESNLGFGLKREALMRTVDSDFSGGFFEEVISTKRDNIHAPACAQCGNPINFRLCTGYKGHYCAKERQKVGRRQPEQLQAVHGMREEVLLFERMPEGRSSSCVSPLTIGLNLFRRHTGGSFTSLNMKY